MKCADFFCISGCHTLRGPIVESVNIRTVNQYLMYKLSWHPFYECARNSNEYPQTIIMAIDTCASELDGTRQDSVRMNKKPGHSYC